MMKARLSVLLSTVLLAAGAGFSTTTCENGTVKSITMEPTVGYYISAFAGTARFTVDIGTATRYLYVSNDQQNLNQLYTLVLSGFTSGSTLSMCYESGTGADLSDGTHTFKRAMEVALSN